MHRLWKKIIVTSIWTILIALYLYQFILIYKYSIDIPFKDEWVYLKPGHPLCLPEKFSITWLLTRISEHHIVATNLLTWFNFKLFGLNYYLQKIINYLLFGFLLSTILLFKNRVIGRDNFRMFPAFLFFLLSPIGVENHSWAFQSQIHLVLLFFMLMLILMSDRPSTTGNTVIFSILAIMAIYSFAAGVILVLACLAFRDLLLASSVATNTTVKRNNLLNAAACTLVIGTFLALWFVGYEKPDYIPPRIWPNDPAFWDYFLNMLGFGFGVDGQSMITGAIILFFITVPLLLLAIDKHKRRESGTVCVAAAISAVLAVLMSISLGRASIGDAKTSRYVEISFLLIPFTAMAWWLLLKSARTKRFILSGLWMFCFCNYLDNWLPTLYLEVYHSDKSTLECVTDYYRSGGDAVCQEYWITPAHLEYAKKLRINFTIPFQQSH